MFHYFLPNTTISHTLQLLETISPPYSEQRSTPVRAQHRIAERFSSARLCSIIAALLAASCESMDSRRDRHWRIGNMGASALAWAGCIQQAAFISVAPLTRALCNQVQMEIFRVGLFLCSPRPFMHRLGLRLIGGFGEEGVRKVWGCEVLDVVIAGALSVGFLMVLLGEKEGSEVWSCFFLVSYETWKWILLQLWRIIE